MGLIALWFLSHISYTNKRTMPYIKSISRMQYVCKCFSINVETMVQSYINYIFYITGNAMYLSFNVLAIVAIKSQLSRRGAYTETCSASWQCKKHIHDNNGVENEKPQPKWQHQHVWLNFVMPCFNTTQLMYTLFRVRLYISAIHGYSYIHIRIHHTHI